MGSVSRRTWAVMVSAVAALAAAPFADAGPGAPATTEDRAAGRTMLIGRWDNDLQVFFAAETGAKAARTHVAVRPSADGSLAVEIGSQAGQVARRQTWRVDNGVLTVVEGKAACRMPARGDGAAFTAAADAVGAAACRKAVGFDALTATPSALSLASAGSPTIEARKARGFVCWVAVLRGAKHGDSGQGLDNWQFQRGLWVHDQGGELPIVTDENPSRAIRLKLRRVEWPSGPNRPSLTLYVHEDPNPRAVSYAWGEADATRLGINVRWLQASCTADPERPFE